MKYTVPYYREDAVMAMIAGTAYCISNFTYILVPNAVGVFVLPYFFTFFEGAKVPKFVN